MPVTVRILHNNFGALSDAALALIADEPGKVAHQIARQAEQDGPVDTGAYISSLYVVSQRENGMGQAQADALAQNPAVNFSEPVPVPDNPTTAIAASAVEHGIFVEFGGGRTAAHGTLGNAAELFRQQFADAVALAIQEAIGRL